MTKQPHLKEQYQQLDQKYCNTTITNKNNNNNQEHNSIDCFKVKNSSKYNIYYKNNHRKKAARAK